MFHCKNYLKSLLNRILIDLEKDGSFKIIVKGLKIYKSIKEILNKRKPYRKVILKGKYANEEELEFLKRMNMSGKELVKERMVIRKKKEEKKRQEIIDSIS